MSAKLTDRQEQVISLVAQGHTDKEIASAMSLSQSCINFHMKGILVRLKAKSRAHAVAIRFIPARKW